MTKKRGTIKANFWFMAAMFSFLTFLGLVLLWGTPSEPSDHNSSMMSLTMGGMMGTHAGYFTLADLFQRSGSVATPSAANNVTNTSSHHPSDSLMAKIHFATTAIIVILIPLIIGGLAFLLVLWF